MLTVFPRFGFGRCRIPEGTSSVGWVTGVSVGYLTVHSDSLKLRRSARRYVDELIAFASLQNPISTRLTGCLSSLSRLTDPLSLHTLEQPSPPAPVSPPDPVPQSSSKTTPSVFPRTPSPRARESSSIVPTLIDVAALLSITMCDVVWNGEWRLMFAFDVTTVDHLPAIIATRPFPSSPAFSRVKMKRARFSAAGDALERLSSCLSMIVRPVASSACSKLQTSQTSET
jgi:hypothetical protein